MHDHDVGVEPELGRALAERLTVALEIGVRDLDLGALQRVVHGLRDLEEGQVAGQDLPGGRDAERLRPRHQVAQQLGDPASITRGVDVMQRAPAQRLRQHGQIRELVLGRDPAIGLDHHDRSDPEGWSAPSMSSMRYLRLSSRLFR